MAVGTNQHTVTKKDLVNAVAGSCDCQQSLARLAVQSFLDRIVAELSEGNRIELREFGVFETRVRDAHKARNPKTKEFVMVPPRASVKFKPGHAMKVRVQALVQGPAMPAAPASAPAPAPADPAAPQGAE